MTAQLVDCRASLKCCQDEGQREDCTIALWSYKQATAAVLQSMQRPKCPGAMAQRIGIMTV